MAKIRVVAVVYALMKRGTKDITIVYKSEQLAKEQAETYNGMYSDKIDVVPINVWD